VLIYVKDKAAALREFYRVLRPGGRISLFEPVNQLMSRQPDRLLGYEMRPVAALAAKLEAFYESIQPRASDPMVDFDDRDLVRHAEAAGFPEIGLELQVSVKSARQLVRSRSKQWDEWGGRVFRELRDLRRVGFRGVGGSGGCVSDRGMRAPEGIVVG
jgi:SAM-dependent methyltransferase